MDPALRKLSALFVVGILLFLSPLMGAFNRGDQVWGIPLLPLYLFVAWAGLIAVAFLITTQKKS